MTKFYDFEKTVLIVPRMGIEEMYKVLSSPPFILQTREMGRICDCEEQAARRYVTQIQLYFASVGGKTNSRYITVDQFLEYMRHQFPMSADKWTYGYIKSEALDFIKARSLEEYNEILKR